MSSKGQYTYVRKDDSRLLALDFFKCVQKTGKMSFGRRSYVVFCSIMFTPLLLAPAAIFPLGAKPPHFKKVDMISSHRTKSLKRPFLARQTRKRIILRFCDVLDWIVGYFLRAPKARVKNLMYCVGRPNMTSFFKLSCPTPRCGRHSLSANMLLKYNQGCHCLWFLQLHSLLVANETFTFDVCKQNVRCVVLGTHLGDERTRPPAESMGCEVCDTLVTFQWQAIKLTDIAYNQQYRHLLISLSCHPQRRFCAMRVWLPSWRARALTAWRHVASARLQKTEMCMGFCYACVCACDYSVIGISTNDGGTDVIDLVAEQDKRFELSYPRLLRSFRRVVERTICQQCPATCKQQSMTSHRCIRWLRSDSANCLGGGNLVKRVEICRSVAFFFVHFLLKHE